MTRSRVVVLDHTGQLGGAEIALLRMLQAVDSSAWQVTVLLFSDGPFRTALEVAGQRVEVLSLDERVVSQSRSRIDPRVAVGVTGQSLGFAKRLVSTLRDLGAELVVANSLKAAVFAELSTRRSRLPWVWHLHDRLAPDYLPRPAVVAMRLLARRATHVVANSNAVARLTGLANARVSVAYPGVPADAFRDQHESPEPPVFGLLGRISPTKGQRTFIEAAALVATDHPDVRFRIVGEALFSDQPYADALRDLPDSLGIAGRVEFAGWATDPRTAIDGFTALVHASPVPEPFGQVIVEAMARKVPVIATNGGGVGEILDAPADTRLGAGTVCTTPYGRLVGPGDSLALASAMQRTVTDPATARHAAGRAFDRAEQIFNVSSAAAVVQQAWASATALGKAHR